MRVVKMLLVRALVGSWLGAMSREVVSGNEEIVRLVDLTFCCCPR